jgi:hypothetical protein
MRVRPNRKQNQKNLAAGGGRAKTRSVKSKSFKQDERPDQNGPKSWHACSGRACHSNAWQTVTEPVAAGEPTCFSGESNHPVDNARVCIAVKTQVSP